MLASFRPYIPTALFALLIFYFSYQALTGDGGLLMGRRREEALVVRREVLKRLQHQRADLELRVRLLGDRNLSRDLLEERARAVLGFADPNDYVVRASRPETTPFH